MSLTWPFPTEAPSQYQRVDQGWDLQEGAGDPVLAVASGTLEAAKADPGGFGDDYPYETLDSPPPGAPSSAVYYGHINMLASLAGQHVAPGQVIGYTQAAADANGSASPAGWLEIGFARPGTGAPVDAGAGASAAGAVMRQMLQGAPTAAVDTSVAGAVAGGILGATGIGSAIVKGGALIVLIGAGLGLIVLGVAKVANPSAPAVRTVARAVGDTAKTAGAAAEVAAA